MLNLNPSTNCKSETLKPIRSKRNHSFIFPVFQLAFLYDIWQGIDWIKLWSMQSHIRVL